MTNQNQAKSRRELLSWINTASFMAYEMVLFLDTHPGDRQALASFQKYEQMRSQALNTYSAQFGPLNLDTISDFENWEWACQPWPWEGGYC